MKLKNWPWLLVLALGVTVACVDRQKVVVEKQIVDSSLNSNEIEGDDRLELNFGDRFSFSYMSVFSTKPNFSRQDQQSIEIVITDEQPNTSDGHAWAKKHALTETLVEKGVVEAYKFSHHPEGVGMFKYAIDLPVRRIQLIAEEMGIDITKGQPLFMIYWVTEPYKGFPDNPLRIAAGVINITAMLMEKKSPMSNDNYDSVVTSIEENEKSTDEFKQKVSQTISDKMIRDYQFLSAAMSANSFKVHGIKVQLLKKDK